MGLLGSLKKTFFPSAQVGGERRLKTFGTTSKLPPILLAGAIAASGAVGLARTAAIAGKALFGSPLRAVTSIVGGSALITSPILRRSTPKAFASPVRLGEGIGTAIETGKISPIVPLGVAGVALGAGALALSKIGKDAPAPEVELSQSPQGAGKFMPESPAVESLAPVKKNIPKKRKKLARMAVSPSIRISNRNINIVRTSQSKRSLMING